MRRILLTNDDGIYAGGLHRLAKAAKEFGEVWIVAPDRERSASSHSITLHTSLDVFPHDFPIPDVRAFLCSGTPGDCVRVGCLHVLPRKPDVVIAGINYGYNAGTDLQYSGTAGAAFEGSFQGCRAIAVSEAAHPRHEAADAWLREVLAELIDEAPDAGRIINVNFPSCALSDCRGILRDRTVSRGTFYRDSYRVREKLPGGGRRLMVEGEYNEDAEEGTDMRAIADGYVSVGFVYNVGSPDGRV